MNTKELKEVQRDTVLAVFDAFNKTKAVLGSIIASKFDKYSMICNFKIVSY